MPDHWILCLLSFLDGGETGHLRWGSYHGDKRDALSSGTSATQRVGHTSGSSLSCLCGNIVYAAHNRCKTVYGTTKLGFSEYKNNQPTNPGKRKQVSLKNLWTLAPFHNSLLSLWLLAGHAWGAHIPCGFRFVHSRRQAFPPRVQRKGCLHTSLCLDTKVFLATRLHYAHAAFVIEGDPRNHRGAITEHLL